MSFFFWIGLKFSSLVEVLKCIELFLICQCLGILLDGFSLGVWEAYPQATNLRLSEILGIVDQPPTLTTTISPGNFHMLIILQAEMEELRKVLQNAGELDDYWWFFSMFGVVWLVGSIH